MVDTMDAAELRRLLASAQQTVPTMSEWAAQLLQSGDASTSSAAITTMNKPRLSIGVGPRSGSGSRASSAGPSPSASVPTMLPAAAPAATAAAPRSDRDPGKFFKGLLAGKPPKPS